MTHLSQYDNHFDAGSVLIAQNVVGKHGARISGRRKPSGYSTQSQDVYTKSQRIKKVTLPVSADGHALKDAVGGARDNVVELVGHAA